MAALTRDPVSPDAAPARPLAAAAEADGEGSLRAGGAGGAPESVGEAALAAQLTQRGLVPEHPGRTRHARGLTCLPARETRARTRLLLHWTAVRNKLVDLPVNPEQNNQIIPLTSKLYRTYAPSTCMWEVWRRTSDRRRGPGHTRGCTSAGHAWRCRPSAHWAHPAPGYTGGTGTWAGDDAWEDRG